MREREREREKRLQRERERGREREKRLQREGERLEEDENSGIGRELVKLVSPAQSLQACFHLQAVEILT